MLPRAQHPNTKNKNFFNRSIYGILAPDALHLVGDLLTQPVHIVAGSDTGSL
ncbi:hypothetical protein ACWGJX_42755 [Streptomyces sp. NPDC054775]|jgi:hypothetical protein|uniref:hypothetical protein n=1 Tax=Streptomyces sp. NPDC092129 TaxID=3366010 RepID=UPI00382EFA91